jgi:hypothetical protein
MVRNYATDSSSSTRLSALGFPRQQVIIVNPATSVAFISPEFDAFLYASIGADRNEMPLSVLSALARLDVDPWQEASELSELPKGAATQRLASLITRLPADRWAQVDCKVIAARLIDLLPHPSGSKASLTQRAHGNQELTNSQFVKILICGVLGITALVIAVSREPSPQSDQSDVPAISSRLPPLDR